MAQDEWLKEYIRRRLDEGISPRKIKNSLLNMGYTSDVIDDYIRMFAVPKIPEEPVKPRVSEESVESTSTEAPEMKKGPMDKKLLAIAVFLGVVISVISVSYFLIFPESEKSKVGMGLVSAPEKLKNVNIDVSKLEILSTNSDLAFNGHDWIEYRGYEMNNPSYSSLFHPWSGNGYYVDNVIPEGSDKEGIVIIHPISETIPRYLAQDITLLEKGNYYLVAEVANIADYVENPCMGGCSDGVIKIEITGPTSKATFEKVLNSLDGWQIIALDISKYAGKSITFRIEGHAGGPCSDWCGEWIGVNEFYIGKL